MFFSSQGGRKGSQRGKAREKRLAGVAATKPRHGERAAALLEGGRDGAAAWQTGWRHGWGL